MSTTRGKILVVDDEDSISNIISRKLESNGYSCVVACSGEEALEKTTAQVFDLVLMDIKMPGLSGIDVLPQITFEQPDICVIMTTAVNDIKTTVEAMNLGAYDYVLKPFDLNDLGVRVEMALERKKIVLENRARAADRYFALLENLSEAVIEFKKGVISWCNDRVEDVFGYSKEELIGKDINHIIPVDIELPGTGSDQLNVCGVAKVKRRDDVEVPVEYSASLIAGKEPLEAVVVIRDISELEMIKKTLRSAEEKYRIVSELETVKKTLRFAEERYRIIFENSAVAITVTDNDENIVSWNKYAEELLGMTKDDLYMKPVSSLYSEEEWQRIKSLNMSQEGMRHHLETEIITKSHRTIAVDLSVSVMKDADGNTIGAVGVMNDLQEIARFRKLEEDQEVLMRAYEEQNAFISQTNIQLEEALTNIKTLSGLLPICAWCKKIRDDSGYWNQIECYISDHSETDFTHGICPECAEAYGMSEDDKD